MIHIIYIFASSAEHYSFTARHSAHESRSDYKLHLVCELYLKLSEMHWYALIATIRWRHGAHTQGWPRLWHIHRGAIYQELPKDQDVKLKQFKQSTEVRHNRPAV